MIAEKRKLFFSSYCSFLVLLPQQHANKQHVVKDRHISKNHRIVGLPNSVQSLSFWFAGDAELDVIPHSKGLWSASQSRKMKKHLPRSLTALDETKLRPHGDDLQGANNHF